MLHRSPQRPGMGDEHEHFAEAAGFMTGKTAALADWHFRKEQRGFERLVAVLRAVKWNRANPDRHRAHGRRYAAAHRAEQLAGQRDRRARRAMERAALPLTCQGCGAEFCRLPATGKGRGPAPAYCTNNCRQRTRYRERVVAMEAA